MQKRLLLLFVALTALISSFSQSFSYNYKNVTFKGKIKNGVAIIKGFDMGAQDVVIPAFISTKGVTYPVKSVSVFINGANYLAVNLELEEGIQEIENFCFNEFRKLRTLTLPLSITHIGKNAIRDNDGLKITMSASIDEYALRNGKEVYSTRQQNNYAVTKDDKSPGENINPKILDKFLETEKSLLAVANNKDKKEKKEKSPKNTDYSGALTTTPSSSSNISDVPAKTPITAQVPESDLTAVDVDIDIPVSETKNDNTYCVIIANEKYRDVSDVDFAERDGNIFKEYCINTLGIPEKQIRSFINASYTDIKRAISWVETMDDISDGNSRIILYYAGHGIPSEQDKTAYLIPSDGFPKDVTTCFKLSDLYSRFGKLKSKSVTILLDACFSGVNRGSGNALIAARGVAIKPREEVLKGNLIVFTATSDEETALSYHDKRHGMFTYFLLDYLKQTKGKGSFGDMFKQIHSQVKKNSMLENDKLQTPSVNVSANMKSSWESMQF